MVDKSIDSYYSSVDKKLIDNLFKNNNLKNLINLSTVTDLYVFNKKNKKWQLKSKETLLKECNVIKKKELKTTSCLLNNLAKLNASSDTNNIKKIFDGLHNKISNLDNIISCIENLDTTETLTSLNENIPKQIKIIDLVSELTNSDSYIECYSNC